MHVPWVAMDEPSPACPVCHRRQSHWGACDPCIDRLDAQLGELLALHMLAQAPELALPATGDPGPIGAHRDPPLPLDLAVLDLAHGEALLSGFDADQMGLESWAVDWRHWHGHSSHGRATSRAAGRTEVLVEVIGYLRAQLRPTAAPVASGGHPAIDEFAQDVGHMHAHARAALRLDEPEPWTIPCPADDGERICGHHLHVDREQPATQVEADADAHAVEWTLRTIRHELDVITDALHHRERLVLATCAATVDAHHCGRAASHDGPHACTCGHTWDA